MADGVGAGLLHHMGIAKADTGTHNQCNDNDNKVRSFLFVFMFKI